MNQGGETNCIYFFTFIFALMYHAKQDQNHDLQFLYPLLNFRNSPFALIAWNLSIFSQFHPLCMSQEGYKCNISLLNYS